MARYIDLDDDEIIYCGNDGEYERYNIPTDAPTADVVERKKGEWVSLNGWITCSKCGCEPPNETNIESDFCPNCGADMRGEEK